MKRRTFLKTAAASLAVPYFVPRHVLAAPGRPGANDRIAAGVIGTGGRIAYVISETPQDIQVVALADCDLRQMGANSTFGGLIGPLFPTSFPSGRGTRTTVKCSTRKSWMPFTSARRRTRELYVVCTRCSPAQMCTPKNRSR